MPALKIAVICALAVYLLVVAYNFSFKLRGVRLWRKLLCALFPLSQVFLLLFPLVCSLRCELPGSVFAWLAAIGLACGPIDILLFRALDDSCRYVDASDKVRVLEEQVLVREELRSRAVDELERADALRLRLREQLAAARESLRARESAGVEQSLEQAICLIGVRPRRFCEHPAVDALLVEKARAAASAGVSLETSLDVPADTALPSVELCAVFGNLVDNALTACAPLDRSLRTVRVTSRLWGAYLIVDVANSCEDGRAAASGVPAASTAAGEGVQAEAPAAAERSADEGAGGGADESGGRDDAGGCVGPGGDPAAEGPVVPDAGDLPDLSQPHGWGQGIVRTIVRRHDGSFEAGSCGGVYRARAILKLDGGDAAWLA